MSEERLNGLVLLSVRNERGIDINEVIDTLAKVPRRLDFVLQNQYVLENQS